jgi:chorismate synthase
VVAQAFLEKFGGDSLAELRRNHDSYVSDVATRMGGQPD